ncbi:MAG: phosphotransferase enzyme family protein, partial [Acidimicrobiales bacterium]
AAATRVAPAFGFDSVDICILSTSENVVCAVNNADGSRAVVRFHRAGYNTIDELNSEVVWVAALAADGVPVPSARPTKDGGFYIPIDIAGETRYVGAVDWVPGSPLSDQVSIGSRSLTDHYARIGEIAAQIRRHNTRWVPPPSFTRRRWDADGFMGPAPLWGRFWEVDSLSASQRRLFADARTALRSELAELSTGPDRFGLIHSDLHLGNLMADGDRLTVIDFDDSGFGWFGYELAVALHSVLATPQEDPARAAMVQGYRSVHTLDHEEERTIDTFLTVRALMGVGWQDARPELPSFATIQERISAAVGQIERYFSSS